MKKIGRYIVRGQLGRGGMGRVYKVEMPVTGKIVALKLLKPDPLLTDLLGLENIRGMFVREAVTMANLKHPNLLDVWDFDEAEGMPFYIMDYHCNNLGTMIGESHMIEKPSRRIPAEKAVRYIRQILEGLACLHYAGVVHRDIKPFNVLITDYDTVKICDFGLSKMRGYPFRGPSNLKVGTPGYASPEQQKDPDAVDFSADLFSVGVMFYRMLTGILPMKDPASPQAHNPDLDVFWDRFLLKAIEPSPLRRYRRARSMLAALDDVYAVWRGKQEKICRYPYPTGLEDLASDAPATVEYEKPRSRPLNVDLKKARRLFGLDELFRPQVYTENDFNVDVDDVVADRATGLLWERSGSEYPMTWDRARHYVRGLNDQGFSGRTDWRLPTVAELTTLLMKTYPQETLCISSVFDETQRGLWSSDRRSPAAAWYVSLDLGFVAWHDHTARCYVRAVCDRSGSTDEFNAAQATGERS
ncbi:MULTISPECIES: protein kinase domain-containing protein [Desulfococcus]|jgi:serine/threonine-protein kinase|nr:DUF1566 domain-containing protein [Desulfococcus multivorans]AOY58069.1 serine/threonine protein kinase [Desulfococcus multivorans]MDX9817345.1 DUF1566 domain-containing protein [Desulfococcus multivorans]